MLVLDAYLKVWNPSNMDVIPWDTGLKNTYSTYHQEKNQLEESKQIWKQSES